MQNVSVKTTRKTQFVNIDQQVRTAVQAAGIADGVAHVFVPHTTAGVTINENADPDVVADLEKILGRLVPWEGGYAHFEGNSAAHMKASAMGSSATVIVEAGQLKMGTWQSLYFCEFDGPRQRQFWVQVVGK